MSDTRSVETSAPDIESAIEQGLRELGVARESVIVEILEEPSRGLLGIGARQARIRLTTAAPARPAAPAPSAALPPAVAEEDALEEEEEEEEAAALASEDIDTFGDATLLADAQPVRDSELDEDARVGVATLEELLAKMEIKAHVAVHRAPPSGDEETPWVLQIQGADLGALIGRRGETLAALQYITRLIASRDLQRRANIVIDVEGYKARREKQLRRLAKRMAEQALQIGRTVTLEPMPPYERRIIHLALRDHPQVTTQSVGEGEHRKVTIIPNRR
ncbi:MAG: Jag N-terminal domain-containing protein [Anaerolineae bacterium]|nr:Jag N-terminal domain-containing protein [Anaerolineae bacterium]